MNDLRVATANGRHAESAPRRELVVAILTCHNRREQTQRALRSWFSQAGVPTHLRLGAVLVDDGSDDGTAVAVRLEFPEVEVIRGDGSLYWAAGMALAEAAARRRNPDALVWLNDDVVLSGTCLVEMRTTSALYKPPAVVAGATADPDTEEPSYGAFAPSRWHPMRGSLVPPAGRPIPVDAVHGNILYVPRAAYVLTRIDDRFQHAYADFDYGLRLNKLGHPVVLSAVTVGWCSRTTSSRRRPSGRLPLRLRLAALNSPRGLPLRSHLRYLRRHGGPLWPVYFLYPYVKETLRVPVSRLLGRDRG